MQDKKKDYKTNLTPLIITLLVLAGLLFVFAPLAPHVFTDPALLKYFDFRTTGQIGDTIGGLMSPFINLSAVIVTGLAFYMQYRANKLQVQIFSDQLKQTEKQFKKEQLYQETQNKIQQFESQFFEMLRLHKQHVDELNIITFQPFLAIISLITFWKLLFQYSGSDKIRQAAGITGAQTGILHRFFEL